MYLFLMHAAVVLEHARLLRAVLVWQYLIAYVISSLLFPVCPVAMVLILVFCMFILSRRGSSRDPEFLVIPGLLYFIVWALKLLRFFC